MKLLKIAGIVVLVLLVLVAGAGIYLKTALPDVGAAADLKIERTPERVARGEYLANYVAVCMDCHSTRDWSKLAAPPLAGNHGGGGEAFTSEMGFPGNYYAPNITPHGLGEWTDGEILRAITTGVNREGRALFPVMGYLRFGKMDQEDLYSIIAYLRTIPEVRKDVPASTADFPVNFLINTMPQKAQLTKRPDTADHVAYGRYLVNVTGCVDCHSERAKGQIVEGTEVGGGMAFIQPAGTMRAPNITFDQQTGLGSWTKEAFINRFKMYADSGFVYPSVPPTELNTPMPWSMYSGMKTEDLSAIYDYLRSVEPKKNAVVRREYIARKG